MTRPAGLLVISMLVSAATAAAPPYVPAPLEPWRDWVLERHRDHACPPDHTDADRRVCAWIGAVDIAADGSGARFTLDVDTFAETDVDLPGDATRWPIDVTVEGRPGVVTVAADRPRIRLEAGRYTVAGRIAWPQMPESLPLPRNHGLLTLAVDDKPVANALVEGGTLWLGRTAVAGPGAANDSLEARVFRRLADGVPIVIETTVDISVAGSNRVLTLGRAVPEGFTTTHLESPLPARVEADGQLRVQVEPGDWRIVVTARALSSVAEFRPSPAVEPWPAQEIWSFAADRALRVAAVEGAPGIDLSQTGAPFQDLPGFLLGPEDRLRLVEQFRGDPNPSPNEFTLARDAWLAFDGSAVVVRDVLSAAMQRPSRLTADFVPGRVSVDGVPQLITAVGDAAIGVELPQGQHRIEAVSELTRAAFAQAPGWQIDVQALQTTLHLPPGWRLVAAGGVDRAPDAWVARWNVWNLFLVLVTAALAGRVLGAGGAALLTTALVLVYHEDGAPTFAWLLLLVLLAALRVSRPGAFRTTLNIAWYAVLAFALVATVVFAVDGFRKALYPQLERVAAYGPAFEAQDYPAAAPPVAMDAAMEASSVGTEVAERRLVKSSRAERAKAQRELYPPELKVQTGPGVPRWQWQRVELGWDGPVAAGQSLTLTLAPPWLTRTWYALGPLLLLAALVVVGAANAPARVRLPDWLARLVRRVPQMSTALLALAISIAAGAPDAHAAELPDAPLLKELEKRLTAPPACMPGCASYEQVRVVLDERRLTIEAMVHADVASAVPLPGAGRQWMPQSVRTQSRTVPLRHDDAGQLYGALGAGRNAIVLEGSVATLDRFELPFPMPPGRLELDVTGWQVYGAEEGRLRGRALQFARDVRSAAAGDDSATLRADPIAPYYAVERELRFGLEWRATTTVRRVAPADGVVPFEVPLLAGESVLTGQVTTSDGRARGVLSAGQDALAYESTLAPAETLTLEAPVLERATELWTLVPSNLWHVEFDGTPPLKLAVGEAAGPRFRPLPGETLTLRASRPTAVPGDSVTVEAVRLEDSPGRRERRSTLTLDVLASQGGTYAVTLPDAATVTTIAIDGRPEPLPIGAGAVQVPLVPGQQSIAVTFESEAPVGLVTRTSAVSLAGAARNIDLTLALSADRWPLAVGGPALGPAVMYWGVLVLVVVLALVLSRIPGMPLSAMDAVLVGLGTSLCNLPGTVIVGLWLLAMLARRRAAERLLSTRVWVFQLLQIALALASVVAVMALAATVQFGLLGAPDMHIAGNDSTAASLRWFQDVTSAEVPVAWVVSLPLWVYRVAMLLWSLWLAFAVVHWARWAWASYSAGAAWRKVEPRRVTRPAPPAEQANE